MGSRVPADCPANLTSLAPGVFVSCTFNVSWGGPGDGALGGVVLDADGDVAAVARDMKFTFSMARVYVTGSPAVRVTNQMQLIGPDGRAVAAGGRGTAAGGFVAKGDLYNETAPRVLTDSRDLYTQAVVGPFSTAACGVYRVSRGGGDGGGRKRAGKGDEGEVGRGRERGLTAV